VQKINKPSQPQQERYGSVDADIQATNSPQFREAALSQYTSNDEPDSPGTQDMKSSLYNFQ
jgi:hypothetical protein